MQTKRPIIFGVALPFLMSFFGLLLLSCNKKEVQPLSTLDHKIEALNCMLSEKEAITQALDIYKVLFSDNELRSTTLPEVLNVTKTSSLRSNDESDEGIGVVIVNFKDNRGYIILSESKYNEPIIAASENGNIDVSTNLENMNLIPFLYNADAILEYNHTNRVITDNTDTKGRPIPDIPVPDEFEYVFGNWELVSQSEPLVQVNWGQRDPHNLKLQEIDGLLPPVGCVATAVSQIMSYHRHPLYDWDKIIYHLEDPYSIDILSTLHRDLGKPEYLDMRYGKFSSGTYSENVPRTLKAYGYHSSKLCEYNFESILSEISSGRPV